MKRAFELEVLADLAALSTLATEDAVAAFDATRVRVDDFTEPLARRIAGLMEARLRDGHRLDFVSMREALSIEAGTPDAAALLNVLTMGVPVSVDEKLSLVRDRATRRRSVEALRVVAGILRDEARPVAEAISEAQSVVGGWELSADVAPTMESDLMPLVDELEAIARGERVTVLPTGIEALDAVIGGLQPTLTVVGAQPGVGKSALVAAICRNLARRSTHVGLVSLEDERGWLLRRLMADAAGVGIHAMLTRPLNQAERQRVYDAAERIGQDARFIHIDGRGRLSAPAVVASARVMLTRGCKAILVDHLGEVQVDTKSERHDLEVTAALSQLRQLAKTYRVPVVVLTHMRRRDNDGEYSEPKLTDFAFSSGIERMARVALGLFRVKNEHTGERDPEQLKCAVLKQTSGVAGVTVTMRLRPSAAIVTTSPASDAAKRLYDDEGGGAW